MHGGSDHQLNLTTEENTLKFEQAEDLVRFHWQEKLDFFLYGYIVAVIVS